MVGMTLAHLLRRRGFEPTVIERMPAGHYIPRGYMLGFQGYESLEEVGIYEEVRDAGRPIAPRPGQPPVAVAVRFGALIEALQRDLPIENELTVKRLIMDDIGRVKGVVGEPTPESIPVQRSVDPTPVESTTAMLMHRPTTTAGLPVTPGAPISHHFQLGSMTLLGIASAVVALVAMFTNVVSVSSTARLDLTDAPIDFRTGSWLIDNLGDNLAIAGLIAAVMMAAGGVAAGFGWRWGAGLAGGAGDGDLGGVLEHEAGPHEHDLQRGLVLRIAREQVGQAVRPFVHRTTHGHAQILKTEAAEVLQLRLHAGLEHLDTAAHGWASSRVW